jgi:DNA-binding winged helix-turn-helix (wHTH) protein/TolB-like protein/Flp pilus assembly protein TadD
VSVPEPHIYEFDDFRLDAARRVLLRRGEPLPLTPRVFDTLLYFVRHHGRVLEKDELMGAIWPDAFVEENNLNQNVSMLRRALGESRGENRYIVTVPGRGYRFAADVRTLADENAREGAEVGLPGRNSTPAHVAPAYLPLPERRAGRIRGRVWPAVCAGVLVAALGAGAFYLQRGGTRTATDPPVRILAVLPFKPLVEEGRDEALELGMADTLIAKLSTSRDLVVRPISSVRRYGGVEQDPVAAGGELGVEAVLDGTIQRWGDRIRVTARLLSISDNRALWAGQFDEKFTDIFEVQDSISERVAGELALRLTSEERALLAKRYTADTEAYELYLKGRYFWSQLRPESLRKAIGFYEEAIGRDPHYALAYAGIGDCYSRLPITSDVPSREAMPKAREATLRALEIDERLAEAHAALGWIKFFDEWDWEGAEREHRRALEINPNYSLAHLGYATLLSCLGRHEVALAEADRALRLDPLSLVAGALKGQSLFLARRYPQAIDHLHRTLEINPNFWLAQLQLGRSYEREGRYEEALEAFRKAREAGGTTEAISLSGYTYAVSGRREEAERTLRELKAISEQSYVPPYNVALVNHGLGDSDEVLRWLERAYDERDAHMVLLGVDPKWDALRSDPRFVSLARRMNLLK